MENTTSASPTLTQGYLFDPAILDESVNVSGDVKEYWSRLIANAEKLGPAELNAREKELAKLLEENGVTYNVYGDPSGLNRPWELDSVPLLINSKEWKTIEKGMQQRAHVLNLLFEDLYGERRLMREKIIPPELIYAHSGFLRPCDNIKLPGKHQLFLYAADLCRGPDGKVWVLRDRTQAPSGMGYALENRSALSRVIPELFSNHHVAKLSGFFSNVMHAFQKISPHGKEQPRIVLLTPGPRNETYFEHAFLASYIGLTLVQGEDLIVRDSFVWMKTVRGLEKVDVILRRVDDTYCDPLELREDSQLGVPGLLEVIRKGNVAVLNPLGSGILENTGLLSFMHSIFRYFLNEDPIFPMVATWWCGQKKEMDYVIDNLEQLVVKKIDRLTGSETIVGQNLSSEQRDALIRRIKDRPYHFVGQEALHLSTAPVFTNNRLEPRFAVVRTFLVAAKDGYEIMPGGLTRCSPEPGSLIVSNQDGGISKDTWIEESVAQKPVHLAIAQKHDLRREAVLPSRAAENLYWVGRYSQRVLRTTRFLRIVLRNITQTGYLANGQESEALKALLDTGALLTGSSTGLKEADNSDSLLTERLSDLHGMICDPDKQGSVLFGVNNLLRAMYAVRDKWSIDNWRIIDDIETVKRRIELIEPQNIRHVFSLLDRLNMGLLSFLEMNRQSLYRGEGWTVYRMGQIIEEIGLDMIQYRALLSVPFDESVEFQVLEALLVSNQNLSNYRSVYRTYFDVAPAIDLVFLNRQNPKSLMIQLEDLLTYINELPQTEEGIKTNTLSNIAFSCYSKVRLMSVDTMMEIDEETGMRKGLDELCRDLADQMSELSTKLSANYFSHTTYQYQGISSGIQFDL